MLWNPQLLAKSLAKHSNKGPCCHYQTVRGSFLGLRNWTCYFPIHLFSHKSEIHTSTNNYLWVYCPLFTQHIARCCVGVKWNIKQEPCPQRVCNKVDPTLNDQKTELLKDPIHKRQEEGQEEEGGKTDWCKWGAGKGEGAGAREEEEEEEGEGEGAGEGKGRERERARAGKRKLGTLSTGKGEEGKNYRQRRTMNPISGLCADNNVYAETTDTAPGIGKVSNE